MRTIAKALLAAFLVATRAAGQVPGGSRNLVANFMPPPPPTRFECASTLDAKELQQLQALIDNASASFNAEDRSDTDQGPRWLTVKTHIHVVAESQAELDHFRHERVILRQISRLNDDFKQARIAFSLVTSDWQINREWARGGGEEQMQQKLAKGGYDELNIFLISSFKMKPGAPAEAIGYCAIPKTKPDHKDMAFYGCQVSAYTTIGGANVAYGMARTGVHEVGHWFGLLHTFEGGCAVQNADAVSDTMPQAGPTVLCPQRRPSCPGHPDLVAPYNIMDYSGE
ncbi:hypothetical protein CP532_6603 [Ophiocordyceps camponoti-leonardi (nom. inval.)]|nr:hypothetical protein CP532_6603 [Ophiocordyceps camponoti-leonardi (nom. inval.)]